MPQSALILSLVVALGQAPAAVHPSPLTDQTRSEYLRALGELEATFGTIRGSGRSTSVGVAGQPDQRISKSLVVFAKKPGMFRSSSSHRLTTRADKESQSPDLATFFNRTISISLERRSDTGSYVIVDTAGSDDASRLVTSMGPRSVLACPYTLEGWRISNVLTKPWYTITHVEEVLSGNTKLLKIHYLNSLKPGASAPGRLVMKEEGGWLLVSPAEKWVLREAVSRLAPGAGQSLVGDRHLSVEYDGTHDGVPIPRRYESKTVARLVGDKQESTDSKGRVARNGSVMSSFVFDFDEFRFDEAPDSDFTFAAFGLPDLGKPKVLAARSSPMPWVFTIAGVALLLAILLRAYAARLRKGPRQSVGQPTPPRGMLS